MGKMEKKNVLIVVDMQNDFINGALGSKEAVAIVPNVVERIKRAIKDDDIIITTQDTHDENSYMTSEEGKNLPVVHCIGRTHGWKINDDVAKALDFAIKKQCMVGKLSKLTFGSVELVTLLTSAKDTFDIENIELIGLCTDICVLSNAVIAKAAVPNAHMVVDAACCAGVTPESHDAALTAMEPIQVEVKNRGLEPWR